MNKQSEPEWEATIFQDSFQLLSKRNYEGVRKKKGKCEKDEEKQEKEEKQEELGRRK